jgi:hypothetical protein
MPQRGTRLQRRGRLSPRDSGEILAVAAETPKTQGSPNGRFWRFATFQTNRIDFEAVARRR